MPAPHLHLRGWLSRRARSVNRVICLRRTKPEYTPPGLHSRASAGYWGEYSRSKANRSRQSQMIRRSAVWENPRGTWCGWSRQNPVWWWPGNHRESWAQVYQERCQPARPRLSRMAGPPRMSIGSQNWFPLLLLSALP